MYIHQNNCILFFSNIGNWDYEYLWQMAEFSFFFFLVTKLWKLTLLCELAWDEIEKTCRREWHYFYACISVPTTLDVQRSYNSGLAGQERKKPGSAEFSACGGHPEDKGGGQVAEKGLLQLIVFSAPFCLCFFFHNQAQVGKLMVF